MLLFGFTLASAQPPTHEGPVAVAFESQVLFTLLLFSFSLLLEFALVSRGNVLFSFMVIVVVYVSITCRAVALFVCHSSSFVAVVDDAAVVGFGK